MLVVLMLKSIMFFRERMLLKTIGIGKASDIYFLIFATFTYIANSVSSISHSFSVPKLSLKKEINLTSIFTVNSLIYFVLALLATLVLHLFFNISILLTTISSLAFYFFINRTLMSDILYANKKTVLYYVSGGISGIALIVSLYFLDSVSLSSLLVLISLFYLLELIVTLIVSNKYFEVKVYNAEYAWTYLNKLLYIAPGIFLHSSSIFVDSAMVSKLAGENQLSFYGYGLKIPWAIMGVLYIVLGDWYFKSCLNNSRNRKHIFVSVVLVFLLAICGYSLSSIVLSVVYGEYFNNLLASEINEIVAIQKATYCILPFYTLSAIPIKSLLLKEKQASISLIGAICFILNIICNFIFIMKYGAIGSIYSTLIVYMFSLTLLLRKDYTS